MPALSTDTGPRVAMVVDRFPHEPFLAQQVAGLLDRGVDVHVLCQLSDPRAPAWALLQHHRLEGRIHTWPDRHQRIRRIASASTAVLGATRASPRSLLRAVRTERGAGWLGRTLFDARVLAVKPDVLHFQFGDLAARRCHAAAATAVPLTASFRGYDLAYAGLDEVHFYDRLWPSLAAAHTLGADLRALATRRGCPHDLEWTIIPAAVEPAAFTPPDRSARMAHGSTEALRLVSVGRLHWKKGLEFALFAVADVVARGVPVHYRIVGGGDEYEFLRWTAHDLGLDDAVEFLGPVPPEAVQDQLAWADVCVHPSVSEGFGNAVLEAQAMELPVVCSDAEGLSENVADGVTGLVVRKRDAHGLADALAALATDSPRRLQMGNAGRARVEEHFSLDTQLARYVAFFVSVAAR